MSGERIEVFRLSDIGEGLTEAEITGWRVAPGDEVRVNQVLLDIETAKVAVELPSPFAGRITELHAQVGDVVRVGGPLVSIARPADAPVTPTVLVGSGPREQATGRRERRPGVGVPTADIGAPRVAATPAARARAAELGLVLADLAPSHPGEPITVDDVDRAHAAHASPPQDPEGAVRTPIHGLRRATAEAMRRSAFTAPHAAEWVEVDVTALMSQLDALRHQANARPVTPLVFVARALVRAAERHADINASWDADRNEIVHFRDVNLGIACATPRGLIVPNVRAAQSLSFLALADAIAQSVKRARAGETTLDEVRHGTISLTNIGGFGVDGGLPILNPGEAAILCMGQVRERPWVVDHQLAVRSVLTITLCFDHRLVDGALASRVLRDIADDLEAPSGLLDGAA